MLKALVARWVVRLLLFLLVGAGGYSASHLRGSAEVPRVPAEVATMPGRLAVVKAEAAARVVWHACPSGGPLDVLALDGGKTLVAVAPQPGRYELLAWSASGGEPTDAARCVLVVEGPPAPPAPDAIATALRAAWSNETDPERDRQRRQLAALFRVAASETVRQPHLRTHGDLLATLKQASAALLSDAALPHLRAAIGEQMRRLLPTEPATPLDESARASCAGAFQRIAVAIESLPH